MDIMFLDDAWQDYLYWQRCDPAPTQGARERATRQKIDKKVLKRINQLIKDIQRNPFEGFGKPEPLKFDMSGARIKDSPVVCERKALMSPSETLVRMHRTICADALRHVGSTKSIGSSIKSKTNIS